MKMVRFSSTAIEKIEAILVEKRQDRPVEVKNPLEINSSADDEDPSVDVVKVDLDPLSFAMRTLAECETQ